ncbi:MAG: N-6 DNA methylase [Bacteroidales bacterium]|nr:N-6 DNA methylase [Bacteroidales bacterium]
MAMPYNIDTPSCPPRDIMHYESEIWNIADLLLSASVKQSDFPTYMMPFFALVMLEGRMLNVVRRIEQQYNLNAKDNPGDFKETFLAEGCGYNDYIVMQGKTLNTICMSDTTFDQDFADYLKAFDDVLKKLLGIERGKSDQKYLNMDGIVAELRGKKILMSVVTAWSKIDLSPYNNSEITTLEEHIKRKWADISASTAGEQYTPEDIITLIADIVASKMSKPKNQFIHVYDPTCGGANLLFGTADRLQQHGYNHIATYGSEYNDALYALAAIESRFRTESHISYGNTLTTVPFADKEFDVIVANPPYGTKWSGYAKEIKNDQKGQFPGGLPAVSDGQLLFMQHILWQLDSKGIAVEVHNGSTLFSGNAGSGESNIRKYIFDHDWVEAIIQMPQDEFFNTGIFTYLWIMNKHKPQQRKDRVALIDASALWNPLKKSKGNKHREIGPEHRAMIVEALSRFEPSEICKIYDREHFYYNKQALTLTEVDDEGRYIAQPIELKKMQNIVLGDEVVDDINGLDPDDAKELDLAITDTLTAGERIAFTAHDGARYYYDTDLHTVVKETGDKREYLGEGIITHGFSTTKKRKSLKATIAPVTVKDYEIIPHHLDDEANDEAINAFMHKYIFKPYKLDKNVVGVELNFNKEFYVPEPVEPVDDILAEIKKLNQELKDIEL